MDAKKEGLSQGNWKDCPRRVVLWVRRVTRSKLGRSGCSVWKRSITSKSMVRDEPARPRRKTVLLGYLLSFSCR